MSTQMTKTAHPSDFSVRKNTVHNLQIHQTTSILWRKPGQTFCKKQKKCPYLWHARPPTHPSCRGLGKRSWQVLIGPAFCCKPQGDGKANAACKCLKGTNSTLFSHQVSHRTLTSLGIGNHSPDRPTRITKGLGHMSPNPHLSSRSKSSHLSESMRPKAGVVGLPSQSCNHA